MFVVCVLLSLSLSLCSGGVWIENSALQVCGLGIQTESDLS